VWAFVGIMTTCVKQTILPGERIDARLPAAGGNSRCG
jgi:hypothetical protein